MKKASLSHLFLLFPSLLFPCLLFPCLLFPSLLFPCLLFLSSSCTSPISQEKILETPKYNVSPKQFRAILYLENEKDSEELGIEEAIIEQNSKDSAWLSFVNREQITNYEKYLRLVYQEIRLSYEGFTQDGEPIIFSTERILEIEEKLVALGITNGFADQFIKNVLDILKKSREIILNKDGQIPSELLPKVGKIEIANLLLAGKYSLKNHEVSISVRVQDLKTGCDIDNIEIKNYQCKEQFLCKRDIAAVFYEKLKKVLQ